MIRHAGKHEKRRVSRLNGAFPVRVRGVDSAGQAFDATSLADNICANGLYFEFPRYQAPGARLFSIVRVTSGLSIAVQATVLRVESRSHGLYGVGVHFARTRVLAA
jgi:hypothetical protein